MTVADTLAELVAEVKACRLCLDAPYKRALLHEPRPVLVPSSTARILIAGQAPGVRVHRSGQPFTDPSGDRLRDWLGVTYQEFYDPNNFAIVPMGFCFPGLDAHGGDLPPRKECAPKWRQRILDLMPQIELVLTVGAYAQAWHMGRHKVGNVTDTVMRWRTSSQLLPALFPLPHPSWRNSGWLKRNMWFETDLLPELRMQVRQRIV